MSSARSIQVSRAICKHSSHLAILNSAVSQHDRKVGSTTLGQGTRGRRCVLEEDQKCRLNFEVDHFQPVSPFLAPAFQRPQVEEFERFMSSTHTVLGVLKALDVGGAREHHLNISKLEIET